MEEEVYNADEKELFELIEFVVSFFAGAIPQSQTDIDNRQKMYEQSDHLKKFVIKHANTRFEFEQNEIEDEKKEWTDYYDATCTHCKFHSSFQPIGMVKDANYYRFFTFKCSKCEKEFRAEYPYEPHQLVSYYDTYIKNAAKRDKQGKIISMKINITEEELSGMIERYKDLKSKVHILDKAVMDYEKSEEEYNGLIKTGIFNYSEMKKTCIPLPFPPSIN